jgi:D-psicose/D-tagatose/L-ribulose 3-epimerase
MGARMAFRFLTIVLFATYLSGVSASAKESPTVRIGYCSTLAEIDAVKAAGFDYIELRTSEVAALSDADFDALAEKLKRIGLPVPVTYQFIPANIKLTGPQVDSAQQDAYVQKALDRVSKLGARTVVLGSGPAREYPEGFSKEAAYRQFVEFCKRLGPEARQRNIVIAIEPLRKQEANIINTLAEGLELVKAVDDPNIQLNVDYYHLEQEKEDPAIILQAKDYVRHVHTANPEDRVFPLKWEEYNYEPFYAALRKIGYDKEVSIEAKTTDFQRDAPIAIAFLRRAFLDSNDSHTPGQSPALMSVSASPDQPGSTRTASSGPAAER